MSEAGNGVLLCLRGVTKSFGAINALDNFSLTLDRGRFIALFGPNGAGKTTLLKVVASLISPDQGEVTFDAPRKGRGSVGYVSHQTLLYPELTGFENLEFFARLYALRDRRERVSSMLEAIGLSEASERRVRGYSRGMKQRLALARALLNDPPLLLLDEPYTGLDRLGSRLLTEILEKLKSKGRTILLVTHSVQEGLRLCDQVVIQSRGSVVFSAPRSGFQEDDFEPIYFEAVSHVH